MGKATKVLLYSCLFELALLLHQHPPAYAAATYAAYPIDWAAIESAAADDSSSSDSNSTSLTSSCMCALLNSGTCTPNCCCDPACPAFAVEGFRAASSCLPEGPPPEQLAYCTPDEPFAKVGGWAAALHPAEVACSQLDPLLPMLC
jgi:hypothetical protein